MTNYTIVTRESRYINTILETPVFGICMLVTEFANGKIQGGTRIEWHEGKQPKYLTFAVLLNIQEAINEHVKSVKKLVEKTLDK